MKNNEKTIEVELKEEYGKEYSKAIDLLYSIITFFMSVAGVFISAFVLMNLWKWFIVPLGVIKISYLLSLGLQVVIAYLFSGVELTKGKSEAEKLKYVASIIIYELLLLSIGFIIALFL